MAQQEQEQPPLQRWVVKNPYVNPRCKLGEGPYYESATNTLRFVDIEYHRLHTVDLTAGPSSLTTLQLDSPVGVTADIAGVDPRERVLAGLKYGLAVLDRKTGAYEYVAELDPAARNQRLRINDGAAGPDGRFWVGTMTDFGLGEFQAEGALHSFTGTRANDKVISSLTIPNSVGWSPDTKTMYFTHSHESKIYAYDYEPSKLGTTAATSNTPFLSNKRVFYTHPGPGDPDGFRVDVDGNLWYAVYGESRVLKISPNGKLVGEILLPTRKITCTQFVGTELFITSAGVAEDEEGYTEEERETGGAVFRVDVGVRGMEPWEFKMNA